MKSMRAIDKTRLYMKHYRGMIAYINNSWLDESKEAEKEDAMQGSIEDTIVLCERISKALGEIEREAQAAGYMYRYEAFVMHYIEGITYERVRFALNCGQSTPKRWCEEFIRVLAIKLFGIRGIENDYV